MTTANKIRICDTEFGPDELSDLRESIIALRNSSLARGDMDSSVRPHRKRMAIVTKGEMRSLWFSLVTTDQCEVFNLDFIGERSSPKEILAHALGEEVT